MTWITRTLSGWRMKSAVRCWHVGPILTEPNIHILPIVGGVFELNGKLDVPQAINCHRHATAADHGDAVCEVCGVECDRICNSGAGSSLICGVLKSTIWVVQELATPWAEQRSKAKDQLEKEIVERTVILIKVPALVPVRGETQTWYKGRF